VNPPSESTKIQRPTIFAIDFGTSNSLLAAAAPGRVFDPAPLDPNADDPTVLRSALYFTRLDDGHFGVAALRELEKNGFRGRLIRSIKRHLASPTFTATRIGDRLITLEQLVAELLRTMRERACRHFGVDVKRAVLGRPARFSNDVDLDALAERRLASAARLAGFQDVTFCEEPVAAAQDFAHELGEPRLVLIADLGGGTSDFTVVRLGGHVFRRTDVLAVGGVPVAGDAIDGSLVRIAVAPHFGSRCRYRVPFGSNVLDMPADLIRMLCSAADLTLADRPAALRRISDIRSGLLDVGDRQGLDRFATVLEDGIGFQLFDAVERCKRALSETTSSTIRLDYPGAELCIPVTLTEMEGATESPLERIVAALDETLATAGVEPAQIEIACLTGGTSRMPLVTRALEARLPRARLHQLRSFHSVVQGLAIRAREICDSNP